MSNYNLPRKVLFFANPPEPHPFIIEPFHKLTNKYSYELKIVDTGVYAHLAKTGEIPIETIKGMVQMVGKDKNVLITCPDYPPLLLEHGIPIDYDNVKRTNDIMKSFPVDENNIYVLQLGSFDKEGLERAISEFNPPKSKFLGLGGLCRLWRNKKEWIFTQLVAKKLRKEFPDSFIHGFGFGMKQLAYCKEFINSIDNSKWTRPIKQTKCTITGKNLGGCKTQEQRIEYFRMYLERIKEILQEPNNNQKLLTEFMEK